jgi:hypothetical protein
VVTVLRMVAAGMSPNDSEENAPAGLVLALDSELQHGWTPAADRCSGDEQVSASADRFRHVARGRVCGAPAGALVPAS